MEEFKVAWAGVVAEGVEAAGAVASKGLSRVEAAKFRLLYVEREPALRAYAIAHVGPDDAEDLVADVFVTAMTNQRFPTDRLAQKAWLYTALFHRVLDLRRSRKRDAGLAERIIEEWWRDPQIGLDPADQLAESEIVGRAFVSLSAADQEIINLMGVWGLTPAQAASALACSETAATTRMERARKRLSGAFARDGARQ